MPLQELQDFIDLEKGIKLALIFCQEQNVFIHVGIENFFV